MPALGAGAAGGLALLATAQPSSLSLLAWLTWLGFCAGAGLGASSVGVTRGLRLLPLGTALLGWALWLVLAGALEPAGPGAFGGRERLGAFLALAGCSSLAWGVGARCARWGASPVAALAGVVCLGLALAPSHAPLRGTDETRARASRVLLEVSPWTFVFETAGVDWMRHPAIYGPARTDWYSDRRQPYAPLLRRSSSGGVSRLAALAAPMLVVVGCFLGLTARTRPCRSASTSARSPSS